MNGKGIGKGKGMGKGMGMGMGMGKEKAKGVNGVNGVERSGVNVLKRSHPPSSDTHRSPSRTRPMYVSRTDEELVRRLEQTKSTHLLRWAPNTFLDIWRAHVRARGGSRVGAYLAATQTQSQTQSHLSHPSPLPTHLALSHTLWLSLNPLVDPTAIWIETKFGVPGSGAWRKLGLGMGIGMGIGRGEGMGEKQEGGGLFEIPLVDPSMSSPNPNPNPHPNPHPHWNPGLIVFELTPLGGLRDRLERKVAVLEDCRRLKGILGELGELDGLGGEEEKGEEGEEEGRRYRYRYFIPSVLFIHWAEDRDRGGKETKEKKERKEIPRDIIRLVSRYIRPSSPSPSRPRPRPRPRPQHNLDKKKEKDKHKHVFGSSSDSDSDSDSDPDSDPDSSSSLSLSTGRRGLISGFSVLSITASALLASSASSASSTTSEPKLPNSLSLSLSASTPSATPLDPDRAFSLALQALKEMDTDGRLVVGVHGIRGLFKLFQPAFDAFVQEWLGNCERGNGRSGLRWGSGSGCESCTFVRSFLFFSFLSFSFLPFLPKP
ncbi:hypothetical protein F5880DRAFT_1567387 [Lentinula raphanica]|nr:hypothetical protein F5880DRAFT_1567387 [Lentinula raphanica]